MEIFTPPTVPPKRPPGRLPKHSPEYRVMVANKVLEEGMSYREAAKTFDLSHGSISAIIKQYQKHGEKSKRNEKLKKYRKEVEAYRDEAQLKDLKLEIAELYLENMMLKKALAYLRQAKSASSSVVTSENLAQLKKDAK